MFGNFFPRYFVYHQPSLVPGKSQWSGGDFLIPDPFLLFSLIPFVDLCLVFFKFFFGHFCFLKAILPATLGARSVSAVGDDTATNSGKGRENKIRDKR